MKTSKEILKILGGTPDLIVSPIETMEEFLDFEQKQWIPLSAIQKAREAIEKDMKQINKNWLYPILLMSFLLAILPTLKADDAIYWIIGSLQGVYIAFLTECLAQWNIQNQSQK